MTRAIKATLYTGALVSILAVIIWGAVEFPKTTLIVILGGIFGYGVIRLWCEFYEIS